MSTAIRHKHSRLTLAKDCPAMIIAAVSYNNLTRLRGAKLVELESRYHNRQNINSFKEIAHLNDLRQNYFLSRQVHNLLIEPQFPYCSFYSPAEASAG